MRYVFIQCIDHSNVTCTVNKTASTLRVMKLVTPPKPGKRLPSMNANILVTCLFSMQEQLVGLEEQVVERDSEVEKLQEQLVQLTEDFRYNLKVICAW